MGVASSKQQVQWWERSRFETPGTRHVIHFNNAGAALPPKAVLDAVQQYTREEALTGGYETANRRAVDLELPYTALAQLLNCRPDEIAIVGSATSAWCQVFTGIPFSRDDRVLTSVAEYGSNYLSYLQAEHRFGVVVEVIPETPDGDIDVIQLQQMLAAEPKPVLVAITHVPTSSGRIYDAAAVGAAAAAAGVPFLLDACQAAGQLPLDVQELQCDFLTGTSRKFFRGPRGIGFLYCRSHSSSTSEGVGSDSSSSSSVGKAAAMAGWQPGFVDIHGAVWRTRGGYELVPGAARYEQYECSFAAKAGFGLAVQYLLQQDPQRCWQRTQELAAELRQQLAAQVPGLQLQDRGRLLCGIVSFTLEAEPDAYRVKQWLADWRPLPINVSVSGIGSSRLDFETRGLQEVVRASVSYYNSEAEVGLLVAALRALVTARTGRQ